MIRFGSLVMLTISAQLGAVSFEDYNQALKLHGEALKRWDAGDVLHAERLFEESVRLDGDVQRNLYTHQYLARLALNRGDAVTALAYALGILDVLAVDDPRNHVPLHIASDAYQLLGDSRQAEATARRSLAICFNQRLANRVAWHHATGAPLRRDLDLALTLAKRVNEETQFSQGPFMDTLAAVHARRGEFDLAVEMQMKAVELVPHRCKADYRSRAELYRLGQPYDEPPPTTAGSLAPLPDGGGVRS